MEDADTLAALVRRYPSAETFRFGDGPELSGTILGLVRAGTKTATCSPLREVIESGGKLPEVGRRDIALDWDGRPALVIETVELSIRLFSEVDADFALAEGEFADLADWQAGHRGYFERNGGWTNDMAIVCERFRLIEDLG